jgi:hypothetical protein
MNPFYYTNLTDTDSHRVVNLIQFPFKRNRSASGYQHATAYTTSMAKRKNAEDVLSQVKELLKKHRAQLDQDEEDEKVEPATADREPDAGGGEENEGEEAPTTKSSIQYSP